MTLLHDREPDSLQRLATFMYLIPIVGVLPSLVALFRRQADSPASSPSIRRQLAVCRLSVLMALVWFVTYIGLNVGADISGLSTTTTIRLLFVNSLVTSGYFIASLWLMVRLWQRKSVRLPGLSRLAHDLSDS